MLLTIHLRDGHVLWSCIRVLQMQAGTFQSALHICAWQADSAHGWAFQYVGLQRCEMQAECPCTVRAHF